jgi:hypothetical protein
MASGMGREKDSNSWSTQLGRSAYNYYSRHQEFESLDEDTIQEFNLILEREMAKILKKPGELK